MTPEDHLINRSNWLRAAVLGANDGILSVASVAIGVAAASVGREPIVLASVAALVAGALSMAAGEYVSVSSQSDLEKADLERERKELADTPEEELRELAAIYEGRGLRPDTALEVARQMTEHDALLAHARDELGISDMTEADPLQAALASGAAFTVGGAMPVLVSLFVPLSSMVPAQYVFGILALALLGFLSARTGGASIWRPILRITFWGTAAMGLTALVGYLFGVNI
ncbi:VIT1/CCC1 transporter family protein [Neolewinella agarilytica]|uniref:Predicted Fe2+/Mn2+ transporter, VIT1/CCC1 family n=1 Tax=Neolewinella agarilytica TaxID=478744 RepID=A0A1H9NMI1_9BACT|nr:VIT family protein [Neolewinella agarilytica]SER37244.1 Predicted Fe2+/Mn2+ transporter, VIT1/CCC1 family [Neolewinella agarilytica]